MKAIGILGGTFDPIHYGHLQSARELRVRLGLDRLCLIPSYVPPHRDLPQSTADQRLAMVKLAIEEFPELTVDDRELRRGGASYTVNTLSEFRQEVGNETSLVFAMGSDAFNLLDTWRDWQSLLDFANVVVMQRDGYPLMPNPAVRKFTASRWVEANELTKMACGGLAEVTLTPWPQSATDIRDRLAKGRELEECLPEAVAVYIRKHGLYQREKTQNR